MNERAGNESPDRGEQAALYAEMAKLNHPACPDVDWPMVEQWCRVLLRSNGGDLQVAVFLALALTHRYGLPGLVEGMTVLRRLLTGALDGVWPRKTQERSDLLAWLATQLQFLLRGLEVGERDAPLLRSLEAELACVQDVLNQHRLPALAALQALNQQVARLVGRLGGQGIPVLVGTRSHGSVPPGSPLQLVVSLPGHTPVAPALYVEAMPAPVPVRRGRHAALWSLAGVLAALLLGVLAWNYWLLSREEVRAAAAEPVRLASVQWFDPASTVLKPDSTKALINALANVKAQPGWLIVIAGHTDATGDEQRNLSLSRQRAEAVRDWMKSMGDVADDCFAVQGHGSSQPIADNATEAGRAANRRVDISLVQALGTCQVGPA